MESTNRITISILQQNNAFDLQYFRYKLRSCSLIVSPKDITSVSSPNSSTLTSGSVTSKQALKLKAISIQKYRQKTRHSRSPSISKTFLPNLGKE